MGKKVLGILGSPRKNGNTARLLKEVLRAAESAGNQVKLVNLYELNIKYCLGCMSCRSQGGCAIKDDIVSLANEIISSDVVVLSAPTYWANVPAIVKNMFDRMAGYMMEDVKGGLPKPLLSKKQGYILITACTTPFPFNLIFRQSSGTLTAMNEFFKTSGMKKKGVLTLTNTRARSDVPRSLLARAEKLGKAI